MHIERLLVRSFRIVERATFNTDALDPDYLQFVSETLARAHASLSPLQITDEGDDSVYLGIGWPEDMQELRAEAKVQQVLGQVFAEMPEPTGTVFYLHCGGWGPVYVVLSADQEEDLEAGAEPERAVVVEELVSELQEMEPDGMAEKVARFDALWEEALGSLPVVLQFGQHDWGQHWDDYAMYVAAAILLEE